MNCKIQGSLNVSENPTWPPPLGSFVIIDHPNYPNNLFVGTVQKYLSNTSGALIVLLNNKDYNDSTLEQKNLVPVGLSEGILMLLNDVHGWKYVDIKKFNQQYGKCFGKLTKSKYSVNQLNLTQSDLTFESKYVEDDVNNFTKCNKLDPNDMNDMDDMKDSSLLNKSGELQIQNLFKEKEINQQLFDSTEKFIQPSDDIKLMLLNEIELNKTIPEVESKIIVNKNIAIKNLIESKDDEVNEGKKIIEWIKQHLFVDSKFKFFDGLKVGIFSGYVHLSRKGIKVDDIITQKDVPNLKYFKWQYGIPIDYDTLKYILFQSDFQKKIKKDIEEQKEAEKIFSQEYLIALQPEPQYQMFALKRLIMCWYADNELQYHIRKIKVIINQYRSRSDKQFNKQYGVLPSIVIYPRYGTSSARKVLKKLSNYFMLYQNIGWTCSKPTYFIKINNLIWYTNGSIDLKLYFSKATKSYDGKTSNNSFNKYFSQILGSERLLHSTNSIDQKNPSD